MGNGQNPNYWIADDVGHVVGEDVEVHSPITTLAESWDFRIISNPGDVLINLIP